MLRNLAADFKEYPATMAFCALWVLVFAAMFVEDLAAGRIRTPDQVLFGTLSGGHRFGDMTVPELFGGEPWRAVTSTFVHYNVLHIGMNLYGMYLLGSMVESWYGPWQSVAIYTAIGGGGNLLSGLIRRGLAMIPPIHSGAGWLGDLLLGLVGRVFRTDPAIHSGGGSTVVLGLVALCAVVGWRSRTRFGDYLRAQMVGVLVLTALLGVISPMIDNWGHAGGATVGAAVGFAHRRLFRVAHRPIARLAGALAALVLVSCGAAQVRDDLREVRIRGVLATASARAELAKRTWVSMLILKQSYEEVARLALVSDRGHGPLAYMSPANEAFRRVLNTQLVLLDAARGTLGVGPTAEDFRRVRAQLVRLFTRPPTLQDRRESLARLDALVRHAALDLQAAQSGLDELKARYGPIDEPAPLRAPPPKAVARGPGP
jgi:membrane associated rhomboid family serine protease